MMTYIILTVFLSLMVNTMYAYGNSDKTNVGTILFSQSDNNRECWDWYSLTLLSSRMILEDLLPFTECVVIKDNSFVTDIVDYYRLLLDVVRTNTRGRIKRIMLLALTDLLGGYLNRFILPRARESYYAGYLSYSSIERLYKLFDELKNFLKTNGQGWAKGCRCKGNINSVNSLTMQRNGQTDPCNLLTLTEKTGRCGVEIPLPFTDSRTDPVAIALPFKSQPFVGIGSKAASYILVRYYVTSVSCLKNRNANQSEIGKFNGAFLDWINGYVLPLLSGEKFYSAFGGVEQIVKTAKGQGMQAYETQIGNYNVMPETQETDVEQAEGNQPFAKKRNNLILLSLLSTIFLWFLLGSIFICYRFKATQKNAFDDCSCPVKKLSSSSSNSQNEIARRSSISNATKSKQSTMVCYMDSKEHTIQRPMFLKPLPNMPMANPMLLPLSPSEKTISDTIVIEEEKPKTSSITIQTSFIDSSIITSSSEETSNTEPLVIEYEISTSSSETDDGQLL